MDQKAFTNLVILVLIIGAIIGYFTFVQKSAPGNLTTPFGTASWKTYTNEDFGFSVKYPPVVQPSEIKKTTNSRRSSIQFSPIDRKSTLFTFTIMIYPAAHTKILNDPPFPNLAKGEYIQSTISGMTVWRALNQGSWDWT